MKEIRNLPIVSIETRDNTAVGVAAPFNSESHDLGGFVEIIAPGAFDRSLAAAQAGTLNIYGLWSHDNAQPIASTRSKKLKLWTTDAGLEFEMDIGRMTPAQRSALDDGDLQKSFGFMVREQEWKELEDGTIIRTLIDVDLSEISFVINPAYPDTSAAKRSLTEWRDGLPKEIEVMADAHADAVRAKSVLMDLHKRAMKAHLNARGIK